MKSNQKTRNVSIISYLNAHNLFAKSIAVSFAIVALASCGEKAGGSMFQTGKDAADVYRSYLSEARKVESMPTERLIETVNDWQTLRDSVFAFIAGDTVSRPHSNYESVIQVLHDSLQIEFTRLALSKPRTLTDVLLVKEQTSRYRQDRELMQPATEAALFFRSLDSIPSYKGSAKVTIENYRSFLSNTLKSGINNKDALLSYIKEEDRLFRAFLIRLPELAIADLSAITRDTEKCCLSVFQSAENGTLSYQDALIYTAKRTNRRVVLNALTCCNDIDQGQIKTEAQARAYVWMLLQPYLTLDGFSMTVLSDDEKAALHEVAGLTPAMIARLNQVIGTDNDQWQTLPGLLIKIMLASI